MSRNISPIETHYAGCRFRSRLEAKWACGFDAAGLTWHYEPQGFEIGPRRYLPDFFVEEWDTWVEVKGGQRRADWALWAAAVDGFGSNCLAPTSWARGLGCGGSSLLILGDLPDSRRFWQHPFLVNQKGFTLRKVTLDSLCTPDPLLTEAEPASVMGSAWTDNGKVIVDVVIPESTPVRGWKGGKNPTPLARQIYEGARAARFEHGESGS